MQNFTPGINPVSYGGGIAAPSQSPLLGMLQQLLQKKIAPESFGTNGMQVPQNGHQLGVLRADGTYQPFVGM
jgi:hypothetical protein